MITPQNSVGLNVYPEHRFFVKKNKDDIKILTMVKNYDSLICLIFIE